MVRLGKHSFDRTSIFFIKSASTYEEFLLLMRAKGYEIKGETFGEDAAKYISFRPLDKEHFVRGSAKSLGKEYTKKRIRERIEKKRERKAVIPKKDYSSRKITNTSDEKFQNSPGLQQWAAIENLKIAAQSYHEAGSLSDLEHKITVKTEAGKSAKTERCGTGTSHERPCRNHQICRAVQRQPLLSYRLQKSQEP